MQDDGKLARHALCAVTAFQAAFGAGENHFWACCRLSFHRATRLPVARYWPARDDLGFRVELSVRGGEVNGFEESP